MNNKRNNRYKSRGSILVITALAAIVWIFIAQSLFIVGAGGFGMIKSSRVALQAQQYAEIEVDRLKNVAYENLDSNGAHSRQAIANIQESGWEDEVSIGSEHAISGSDDAKQRIATINVYKSGDTLPRFTLEVPLSSQDNVIYQKMQTAIRQMKEQHERGDSFRYWEKSIRIMQETLNRFNAFQNLSKTVAILTVGVARAAKECEVQMPPELEQIQKQLQVLNQQTDRRKQDWTTLRETADRVVKISTQLVGELREKRAKNPLFQLVEVQHAKPLAQVLREPKPVPKELYFASLRQIARGNPGILPDQADLLVAKQLRAAKLSDDVCLMALRASPCFRQLDSSQRMAAARSVLDTVDAPPEHKREEGNHR